MTELSEYYKTAEWDSQWTPISEMKVGQSIWSGLVQCPLKEIVRTPAGWTITVYNPFYKKDCTYHYALNDELMVVDG